MNVGLLLVTHPGIGEALLRTAEAIVGVPAPQAGCLDVPFDADLTRFTILGRQRLDERDHGDGVLVLVDCPGATPANLARLLAAERTATVVVTGLNLPMLLRLLNTPEYPLDVLCRRAVEGGREAIRTIGAGDA